MRNQISDTSGIVNTDRIAALPMYDFPDVAAIHDVLWLALAERLSASGVSHVPRNLTRHLDYRDTWRHPGLLLGQACEYPLAKSYGAYVRMVATPRYAAPGCQGALCRSAIMVRKEDAARSLADLKNRRCAVNAPDSNSGMNLFRAAIAPMAAGAPFFESVAVSGSHWNSARMVACGWVDVAAVDCVTFAHLRRCDPALVAKLRMLDWTPASPSLPYITAKATDDATLQALRDAMAGASVDSRLTTVCKSLFLVGFDFEPDRSLSAIREHEQRAAGLGYPVLI